MKTLNDLGRRVERLFYIGAALLILCLVEVYLVATVTFVKLENPAAYQILAGKIDSEKSRLSELYSDFLAKSTQKPVKQATADGVTVKSPNAEINRTRSRLGLGPHIEIPPAPDPLATTVISPQLSMKTYPQAMDELFSEASEQSGMDKKSLINGMDLNKDPAIILQNVQARGRELTSKPVLVWGIETPINVPLAYGAAQYQVPASVLATFLLIVLGPLLTWWFGSLALTRQRELYDIRNLEDYRFAFPHILNILPVVFLSFPWIWERRLRKSRTKLVDLVFSRVFCATLRSLVILALSVPMIFMFFYSAIQMFDIDSDVGVAKISATAIFGLVLICQILNLILQEWIILWNVNFRV
jgi:hypothetical protein